MRNLAAFAAVLALSCPAWATLTSTNNSITYTGNGSTKTFTVPFKFLASTDLVVTVGGITKALGPDYTVKGAGNANGTVTTTTAPTSGTAVVITRSTPLTQTSTVRQALPFPAGAAIDGALDKLTMEHQDGRASQAIKDTAQDLATTNVLGAVSALNTGSHAVGDTTSILAFGSSTARTLTTRFSDMKNVKDYGALCNNSADDTTAIQAAITAAQALNSTVYVPPGTCLTGGLTITGSVRLTGEGVLKLKNSTAADMISISGTSTVVRISGLTFDGNEQNQAVEAPGRTIHFIAVGTASAPAGLEVRNCLFVNGPYADVRVHTDGTVATSEWVRITGNTFLAGREGTSLAYDPRYVDLTSPTDYVVSDNVFDRLGPPTTFGRAGVVAYDGFGTFVEGRGSITGNTFVQVGRSQATSSVGNIDLYSRAHSVVISGNSLTSPYGRGINVKAESRAVAITGNTVEGLAGGSDGTMSSQIVLNASSTAAEANGPFTIAGNSLINSGNDAISITARDTGGTVYAHGVLVTGNTITNATRRPIGVATSSEVSVLNNVIYGGAVGIFVDATTTAIHITGNQITSTTGNAINITSVNTTAILDISANTTIGNTRGIFIGSGAGGTVLGNVIKGPATSGVDISGTTGPLRVAGNYSDATTPFVNSGSNTALHLASNDWTIGTTAHQLTIATGVVTATMDWHYLETEAGAATDDLDTINGGYDGQILTLRPLNAAHVVTVKDSTGNLRMQNDFTLDNPQDSITFRWVNDAWIETSRSNNNGGNNSGIITLVAGTGTANVTVNARCVCTDSTAAAAVKCANAGTTLTATGTGTDVITYYCF